MSTAIRPLAAVTGDWSRRPQTLNGSWEDRAACYNRPESWWDGENDAETAKAKETCLSCPVLAQCLTRRMAEEGSVQWTRYGIRGGLAGVQRTQLFLDEREDGGYDAEEARLLALEAKEFGMAVTDIAPEDTGTTTLRLAARLAGEKLESRKPAGVAELRGGSADERAFQRAEDIMRWREEGVPVRDIGPRLGLGRRSVDAVLKAYKGMAKDAAAVEQQASDQDIELFLSGKDIRLTATQQLAAIAVAVQHGKSYLEIDRGRGVPRDTTAMFVSRQRKSYAKRGKPFPVKAQVHRQFTNEQVVEMRELYARGGITDLQIAMKYGVARNAVSHVLSGRNYRDAGGPIRATRSKKPGRASRLLFCGHTDATDPTTLAAQAS